MLPGKRFKQIGQGIKTCIPLCLRIPSVAL